MEKCSKKIFLVFFAVLTLWVMAAGCSRPEPARTTAAMAQEQTLPYTVGPGDVIDVKLFYTPELDESQIVRPDDLALIQFGGVEQLHVNDVPRTHGVGQGLLLGHN